MKSIADRQKLYQDYISHYESRSREGNVTLCDHNLECRGDTQLHDSPAFLGEFYSQLIRHNLQTKKQERREEVLKQMMKGFAILELICVNLFLFPWRKEIRTLKKFTGNFVYFVEPVIPEDTVTQILQRVGYSVASDMEYTIRGKINTEEARQTAFELYLCRVQCEKLLWLKNEERSVSVSLLLNWPSTEPNNESEHADHAGKITSRTDGIPEIDGKNSVDFKSNVSGNNDTTKASELTITHTSSQDHVSDTSKKDPHYYLKHIDSDEFLNKYSDLNLAQQPILQLSKKQNKPKQWAAPVSEEPNFAKPIITEPFPSKAESAIPEGRDLAEKVICGQQGDNIDIRTFTDNLDHPKPLVESTAEAIVSAKQERVVTKLKMQNIAGESLAYLVKETLPPDSDSSDLGRKWAFLKTKEGTTSFVSPKSSDFSMLNTSTKSASWTPGTENRLREPPNSTYIPPMAPESECIRLTNIKPEENHFPAPSPLGDEFNIHEDPKEDYVMITRKDYLQI